MDARVEALADTLKNVVEKTAGEAAVKTYLDGNKVVLIVGIDGVRVRVVEPTVKKESKKKISPEVAEKLKAVKKALKSKLDVMNVVVLLVRINEELKKVDLSKLSEEEYRLVEGALVGIRDALMKTKLLEARRVG